MRWIPLFFLLFQQSVWAHQFFGNFNISDIKRQYFRGTKIPVPNRQIALYKKTYGSDFPTCKKTVLRNLNEHEKKIWQKSKNIVTIQRILGQKGPEVCLMGHVPSSSKS